MCGIAGYLELGGAPVAPDVLQRMTDVLAHRGPDGQGIFLEGNAGLGHRRLAIIDLSDAAAQPFHSADGRFVLSYNGEVYNYRELRRELESAGAGFRSASDTEVVLQAFQHWGPACVLRFNGMFAFAVWDRRERTLFLARDRYGIKPLYYSRQGNIFAFGSEQKAILAIPGFSRRLDKAALLEYYTFQNIFSERTLLEDVKVFPAGHYGVFRIPAAAGSGNQAAGLPMVPENIDSPLCALQLTSYWDFNFQEPAVKADKQEYLEELDRLFKQAVSRQMVTDVELGAYLSGGVDSGSITAIAAQYYPYIKTFTCGFDLSSASGIELAFDERTKAEAMSYRFKTEHYQMVLKAGDMERCLPKLAWHLEEPRVGQSYPNYYAAYLASKFVKVVLGGTGGDELFGGYPWRYYRAVVNSGFEDYVDKYYRFWQRLIPNSRIKQVFAPVWPDVRHVWTRDIFRQVFRQREHELNRPEDYINYSLYFEAKTFLHGLLLVEDKLSMAHGLESRVPFLDNDLVDFAMRCPVNLKLKNLHEVTRINENEPGDKVNNYFRKTRDGKLLLRQALARYVPENIANGRKQGFSAPDASWFKGESINYVAELLLKNQAAIYEYLDREAVRSLVMEHLEGKENRRLLIWSLLATEHWLRQYITGQTSVS